MLHHTIQRVALELNRKSKNQVRHVDIFTKPQSIYHKSRLYYKKQPGTTTLFNPQCVMAEGTDANRLTGLQPDPRSTPFC
jgi:hypothetical protein